VYSSVNGKWWVRNSCTMLFIHLNSTQTIEWARLSTTMTLGIL
jgi:hypothetical protein